MKTPGNPSPSGPIAWPSAIPMSCRRKVDTGKGSFCLVRDADHSTAFCDQHVILSGHVLVLAMRGEVVVEAFGRTILMRPGDALLLGDCEARITEVSQGASGCVEICYFFFDSRVVGREVGTSSGVESLAWRNSAPDSYFQSVGDVVPQMMSRVRVGQLVFPRDLSRILRIFVNFYVPASFFSILRRTYFQPRARLSAFVERHVLGYSTIERIARDFPEGRAEFFKQFAKYHVQTPEDWLRRRRMELAQVWLGYGDVKVDDVASVLGYKKRADFRRDKPGPLRERLERIERAGSHADLSARDVQRLARPFWIPRPADDLMPFRPPPVVLSPEELADVVAHAPRTTGIALPKEPEEPPKAAIDEFWAMKTTGMGTIFTVPEWISDQEKIAA